MTVITGMALKMNMLLSIVKVEEEVADNKGKKNCLLMCSVANKAP